MEQTCTDNVDVTLGPEKTQNQSTETKKTESNCGINTRRRAALV